MISSGGSHCATLSYNRCLQAQRTLAKLINKLVVVPPYKLDYFFIHCLTPYKVVFNG